MPNNAMFIVVGDVDKEEFVREIDDLFGSGLPANIRRPSSWTAGTRSRGL